MSVLRKPPIAFFFFAITTFLIASGLAAQNDDLLAEKTDSTVKEQCVIESASRVDIRAPLNSTILWLPKDGQIVKEGDVVAKLDSSELEDLLNQQKILYSAAEAEVINAKGEANLIGRRFKNSLAASAKALSTAKLALKNFTGNKGIAYSEIMLAEAELSAAEEKLKFLQARRERESADVALQVIDARLAVTAGKVKLKQLKELHHPLRKAELETVVADKQQDYDETELSLSLAATKAEAQHNRAAQKVKIEEVRLRRLQQQLSQCAIRAPASGTFKVAQSSRISIEAGSRVRERQTIASVIDGENFRTRILVKESQIAKVKIGQNVRISVSALPDEKFFGRVTSVSRFANPANFRDGAVKKYAVIVKLSEPSQKIRHGMTAQAEIKID